MRSQTESRNADTSAFELGRCFDLRANDEAVLQRVEKARDDNWIGALQPGRGHGRTGHAAHSNVSGNQSGAYQGALQIQNFRVDAVLLKQASFAGEPNRRVARAQRTVADTDLVCRTHTDFG